MNIIPSTPSSFSEVTEQTTDVAQTSHPSIDFDPSAEPIWELAARLSAEIPLTEWQKLPTDLARNFDWYQQQHP